MYKKIAETFYLKSHEKHHELIKQFIEYVNHYEKFEFQPSHRRKQECARRLRKIKVLSWELHSDLNKAYKEFIQEYRRVSNEINSKKESKGKSSS
jgi:phosphoglycerate-specific signal transduction histidine kinase